ncbi:unnamed protein product [Arctia plantaginis]|uniref:PiggyBac transposable element-derived protein domain-containing protein n=1 Tax=Arctia plantaginis TaxID=874455 RepID=A0A8S1A496_ARCPL|nr:unnamed protein product [Arctia plantaginis]
MEYSSHDSVQDPNFMPDEDFSDTSTSDDNDSQIWNPPRFSRRLSTCSDSDIPPLPEIERLRSLKTAPVDSELQPPNVPSTSGSTDAQISEQEWMEEQLSNIQWEMPSHDDHPAIDYTVPSSDSSARSRNHLCTPVTRDDMLKFLALVEWMDLVKLPSIKDYWRNHKLYGIPLARPVMPRNRFELILKFVYFASNQTDDTDDRLYKIKDVLNMFIKDYQNVYTPGEKEPNTEVSEKVVLSLAEGLFNEGRTRYTDNYYTSVPLALRMRKRKTHLVGTLRSNRKYLPKEVTNTKLKKGEIAAQQSSKRIVALKWRDKRDVLILSTKQSGLKTIAKRNRRGESIRKPACIEDYNLGMLEGSNHTSVTATPSSVSAKHYLVPNMKDGVKKKARCSECYKKYGRYKEKYQEKPSRENYEKLPKL